MPTSKYGSYKLFHHTSQVITGEGKANRIEAEIIEIRRACVNISNTVRKQHNNENIRIKCDSLIQMKRKIVTI